MSMTLNAIESLIKGQLLSARPIMRSQTQLVQGFITLAVLFFFLSIGFILYGVYTGLSVRYSVEITSMIMGLILGVIAAMISLMVYLLSAYRRKYMRHLHRKMPQKIHDTLLSLDDELGGVIRDYPKTAALIASIAGFVAESRL